MTKNSPAKIPVTLDGATQRCRRKLQKRDQKLVKNRRAPDGTLGKYFIVDIISNIVVNQDVDIRALAKELGCIEDYETIEE